MISNYYEEFVIKNNRLPEEWQSKESQEMLEEFLQLNWQQRKAFFNDGDCSTRQQFLSFTGQGGIRTNNYIGTIVLRHIRLGRNSLIKTHRYTKSVYPVHFI